MGRDGVADLHVTMSHEHSINQQCYQSPLLCKRRVSSAGLYPLAKRRHGLDHPRQCLLPIHLALELLFLCG